MIVMKMISLHFIYKVNFDKVILIDYNCKIKNRVKNHNIIKIR